MSHLRAILDLKNELTELGIKNAVDQEQFINEGYVRALTSRYTRLNISLSLAEFNDLAWIALEQWNKYTPVPARFIMSSFCKRLNEINDTLIQFGTVTKDTVPSGIQVDDLFVEFESLTELQTLVETLLEELKNGRD